MIPSGTMHKLAFEHIHTWYVWKLPGVQHTRAVEHYIAIVFCMRAVFVYQFELPLTRFLVPGGRIYGRVELDIFLEIIFGSNVLEILPYLL